jgi:hypothetical protein
MPGESYGGPYFGTRTLLVFDGDGNYLNRNIFGFTSDSVFLGITSATTAYVANGGITFATNAQLQKFVSSVYFAKSENNRSRVETGRKAPGIRNPVSFANAKTKSQLGATLPPNIRTLSKIDPRSTHFIYLAATSGYFTADHLDEIQIKTTTGLTLQAFFGGSADGNSAGVTGSSGGFDFGIYLVGVGRTAGVTGATGFIDITAGNTVENMVNGITTELVALPSLAGTTLHPNVVRPVVDFESFKRNIASQMPTTRTRTITSTFIDSSSVSYQYDEKLVEQLQKAKTFVDTNHKVYGNTAAAFISEVVITGLSGATFPLSATGGGGHTGNANQYTGFTGSSKLDVVVNDILNYRFLQFNEQTNLQKLDPFDTVRELEQVDFLSL